MHRIEGSISDLVKTLALPCKKMKRTLFYWVRVRFLQREGEHGRIGRKEGKAQ
jgi:hypothetical protein